MDLSNEQKLLFASYREGDKQYQLAGGQEALNQRMEIIQFLEGLDLSPSYFSTNELKVEEAPGVASE